jgi:hypothetical protein
MKKFGSIVLVAGVLMVGFVLAIIVRDLKHKAWMEWAPGQINRVAAEIEMFREEQGFLPKSLLELQARGSGKESTARMLTATDNRYQYRIVSMVIRSPSPDPVDCCSRMSRWKGFSSLA